MSLPGEHRTPDKPVRLQRAITNMWIHSRSENWEEVKEFSSEDESALYLLTTRHISFSELDSNGTMAPNEMVKMLRKKNQASKQIPFSVFTQHTSEYCEETKKTYSNEHTYYTSPPGKSFLGSI